MHWTIVENMVKYSKVLHNLQMTKEKPEIDLNALRDGMLKGDKLEKPRPPEVSGVVKLLRSVKARVQGLFLKSSGPSLEALRKAHKGHKNSSES